MTDRTREECLEQFIKTFRGSLDARLWIKLVKEDLILYRQTHYFPWPAQKSWMSGSI